MCCWLQLHDMQWTSQFFEIVIVASCNEYFSLKKEEKREKSILVRNIHYHDRPPGGSRIDKAAVLALDGEVHSQRT